MRKFTSLLVAAVLMITANNIASAQRITMTIAGVGGGGYTGDGGPAKLAKISAPEVLCSDPVGNIFFIQGDKVRMVSVKTGIINTIAGGGTSSADGIPATNAALSPACICSAPSGKLYVYSSNKIRVVDPGTGVINTFAGTGTAGFSGEGGPAIMCQFNGVTGLCSDAAGNIYAADNGNHRIRKIAAGTGIVSTVAGTGVSAYTGDGGPASVASVHTLDYIGCSAAGDIFFSDYSLNYIRKIDAATGYIYRYAGGGSAHDHCPALNITLGSLSGMCVSDSGDVCIDESSCSCREISAATDSAEFIGGNWTTESYKDDTNSLYAWFNYNYGLAADGDDNVYVADRGNNRIRKVIKLVNTPTFVYGRGQTITPCPGYSYPLDPHLAVTDIDAGQYETWSVVTPPAMGVLTGFPASTLSNSTYKTTKPAGVFYTAPSSYTGRDSFRVRVTDGALSDTLTIYATVQMATPATVSGPTSVCIGASMSLSAATAFPGSWTASNAHATIGATGGVHGVSAGVDTMIYTMSSTCPLTTSYIVTINPVPTVSPISGSDTVCLGASVTMTDSVTGGLWEADFGTTYVSVDAASGVVAGLATGSDNISYTVTNAFGCHTSVARAIEVATIANPITGAASVCIGASIPLHEAIAGGTWSVSNANGTITSSSSTLATFTGVTVGTDVVIYTNTNVCGTASVTKIVSINPMVGPGTVSGPSSVCLGDYIHLTPSLPGGTWSAANSNASVGGGGNVWGDNPGVDTVYYFGACATSPVATVITVNPLPGGTIAGANTVCLGSTITLSDITPGGSWTASNSNATVVASGPSSAVVTGVTAGTVTISYTSTNVCGTGTVYKVITISPWVSASGTISGPSAVCTGAAVTYTHTVAGGAWSMSNAFASIGSTGIVTGISSGVDTVIYTAACALTSATAVVTVNPSPDAGTISGADTVCIGAAITLTDAATGGVWTRSLGTVSIGSGTGVVTGISYGSSMITYTVSNAWCIARATKLMRVTTAASAISGLAAVCIGSSITLGETINGGTWSLTNGNASISASTGTSVVFTGLVAGVDTVMYTNTNICGTAVVMKIVTINPMVAPGTLSGPSSVCIGSNITLVPSVPGGTWSVINAHASSYGSGLIHGVSAGVDTILYTGACATGPASATVSVNPLPSAGIISGSGAVCVAATASLSDTVVGGSWSSLNPLIGSVNAVTGVVTGGANGTASIRYTVGAVGCTAFATKTVTVGVAVSAVSGANKVCTNATATLSDLTAGGTWTASNSNATVGLTSGLVTGVAAGVDTIMYAFTNACGTASATKVMTVYPLPVPGTISGPTIVCVGLSITLTSSVAGGTWSAANANAIVGLGTGIVSGMAPGTDNISYTVTSSATLGSCKASVITTVTIGISDAGTVTGPSDVCAGSSVTLSDLVSGGIWSTTNSNASVSASGVVTGLVAGLDTVMYTVPSSCGSPFAAKVVSISSMPDPGAITGPVDVCAGGIIILSDYIAGGVWSAANGNVTVSATGMVVGVSGGVDTIRYSVTNACGTASVSRIITVGPLPDPGTISGETEVCIGESITLSDLVPGGIWSQTNTGLILDVSGAVTGAHIGLDTIFYAVSNSCGTSFATIVITVKSCATTGINVPGATHITVFPNPVVSSLNIEWTGWSEENAVVIIRDVAGREVLRSDIKMRSQEGTAQLNIADISDGIYLLTIQAGSEYYTDKLVISR